MFSTTINLPYFLGHTALCLQYWRLPLPFDVAVGVVSVNNPMPQFIPSCLCKMSSKMMLTLAAAAATAANIWTNKQHLHINTHANTHIHRTANKQKFRKIYFNTVCCHEWQTLLHTEGNHLNINTHATISFRTSLGTHNMGVNNQQQQQE